MSQTKKYSLHMLLASSIIALAACQANGGNTGTNAGGSGGGGTNLGGGIGSVKGDDGVDENGDTVGTDGDSGTSSGSDTGFPNDPLGPGGGDVSGNISEQQTDSATGETSDVQIAYEGTKLFQCSTSGADATAVGANGLVGGVVTPLLEILGGDPVNALTNGVSEPLQAIDQDMRTASTWTIAASALLGQVDSLDQVFFYNAQQSAYAVAAVSFPSGTVDLGLVRTITLNTYLDEFVDGERVESTEPTEPAVNYDATSLDLLGQTVAGSGPAFIGRKVTTPYNRIVVSLSGDVLAADVGEAMYLHEICVNGSLVDDPDAAAQ